MDAKEILEAQYNVLAHENKGITEIRIFGKGSYWCKNKEEFVNAGLALCEAKEQAYVGINPRGIERGTADDIPCITALVVDIDPIRPKDSASTDEQLKASIVLGTRIRDDFGGGIVVSSGSGCHVYLPIVSIPITNRQILSDSLRQWNKTIKETYGTKELKIDSIWDFPRVIRLWGSFNARSQRICGPTEQVGSIARIAYTFSQEAKPQETVLEDNDETTQKFKRLIKANKYLASLSDGSVAFESKSEADMAFICTLGKALFTEAEIEAVWEHNRNGNKEPKKGDIKRCLGKITDKDEKAVSLAEGAKAYYEALKLRRMGIRTGFRTFDEMISGLKDGKLILIGARPGTGKTTLVTQILAFIAGQGIPCLFFPTEVGAEPIIDKIIASKCGIALKKFQNGTFSDKDLDGIVETREYISKLPFTIYEDFGLNIDKYEQIIDKYAPKVVCLDYFQALKWEDPSSLGEKEDAVRRIKKITKDRNITTICLSQLNRGSQGTGGKAAMAELKGTAALEELGDVICQMYKSDQIIQNPKIIDLVVTKSKYSATGNIVLDFHETIGKFVESASNDTGGING